MLQTTKNDLIYICHFKINAPYQIEKRAYIPLTIYHRQTVGDAVYDGVTFEAETNESVGHYIEQVVKNGGGFSHGGDFDNRGIFILQEVSIVKFPRFKTTDFRGEFLHVL